MCVCARGNLGKKIIDLVTWGRKRQDVRKGRKMKGDCFLLKHERKAQRTLPHQGGN